MFSGIVEASSEIIAFEAHDQSAQVVIKKPNNFNDLKIGDSLSVNGVCLTIEALLDTGIQLSLGPETLKITGWAKTSLTERPLNLERSMKLGDRVHGHFVLGHVDAMGEILASQPAGDCLNLKISYPKSLAAYLWKKGSVTVNGVSLTVNAVSTESFDVCLIPETLKRTNLSYLKAGHLVTLEVDSMARALVRAQQLQAEAQS